MRIEVGKDYQFCYEGNNLRNVALPEFLSGIDHMEVNRNCVIGEAAGDPRRTTNFGESVREFALLRTDLFGGGFVTALTTAGSDRVGKGGGNKGEEDSENDRETKNHVRRKTTNEGDKNEREDFIAIARDI